MSGEFRQRPLGGFGEMSLVDGVRWSFRGKDAGIGALMRKRGFPEAPAAKAGAKKNAH